MLVELGLVELRYHAVLEVLQQGAPVTEVALIVCFVESNPWKIVCAGAAGGR